VNADRVKEKLPGLLTSGKTTKRKNWNEFMRKREQLQRFVRDNPQRFNSLTNQLISILNEIDRELCKS